MSNDESLDLGLQFDSQGLIPVIVQDALSKDVLMMAYMNAQSLDLSLKTGFATYWSRSRQKLWMKGESSGNRQKIRDIYVDCDQDCLMILIDQEGGRACHTGRRSCFYRTLKSNSEGLEKKLSFKGRE
jgi:phosphoribosyl-AMP cyclohydrolase